MKASKEITLTLLLTSVALAGCNEQPPSSLLDPNYNKECSVVDQTDRCKEQRINRLYSSPATGYNPATPPLNLGSTSSHGGSAFVYVPGSRPTVTNAAVRPAISSFGSIARGGFGASAAHFGGIGA